MLWWLPDSPMRATCWSPEDRILIAERVRKNDTGIQNREFKVCTYFSSDMVDILKNRLDLSSWSVT